MYSEGAMNSMVADRTSGLLCGSPYVFVTGSNENSSGTEIIKMSLSVTKYFYGVLLVKMFLDNFQVIDICFRFNIVLIMLLFYSFVV